MEVERVLMDLGPSLLACIGVCVLGVAVLALVGASAVLTLKIWRSYTDRMQQAFEVVVRHQDSALAYQAKATADALAAGRQPATLSVGGESAAPTSPTMRAVRRLADEAAEDVPFVSP